MKIVENTEKSKINSEKTNPLAYCSTIVPGMAVLYAVVWGYRTVGLLYCLKSNKKKRNRYTLKLKIRNIPD